MIFLIGAVVLTVLGLAIVAIAVFLEAQASDEQRKEKAIKIRRAARIER